MLETNRGDREAELAEIAIGAIARRQRSRNGPSLFDGTLRDAKKILTGPESGRVDRALDVLSLHADKRPHSSSARFVDALIAEIRDSETV